MPDRCSTWRNGSTTTARSRPCRIPPNGRIRVSSPSPDMSEAVLPAAVPARQRRRWRVRHVLLLINIAALATAFMFWWLSTRLGWIAPIFLPAPGDVWHAAQLTMRNGDLLTDVLASAQRVFLGFGLAAVIA